MATTRQNQNPALKARQDALEELRMKVEEAELNVRLRKARDEIHAFKLADKEAKARLLEA